MIRNPIQNRETKRLPLCAVFIALATGALAQTPAEPEVSADEFPRAAPTEPADALATFEMAPGFDLTLAAHEPAVVDPIAMAFDEKGRAYVVEMVGYSERRDDEVCQVRLLTDVDGDGKFDQSVVFKNKIGRASCRERV